MSEAAFEELIEHWREEPPIAPLIRSYLGFKPPTKADKAPRKEMTEEEWKQLVRAGQADAAINGRAS